MGAELGDPAEGLASGLLTDSQIQSLVNATNLVEHLPPAPGGDWKGAYSPIQPVSVDLHVGCIFVPGVRPGRPGSAARPLTDTHILRPGATAVILTSDELNMPGNIAGFGFAPTALAMRGILVPTVGHIDPGWQGPLRIVTINMGRESVDLAPGDKIATVLFYKLSQNVSATYDARRKERGGAREDRIKQSHLNQLAPDFADFTDRSKRAAQEVVDQRFNRFWLGLIIGAIVLPILVGFSGAAISAGLTFVLQETGLLGRNIADVSARIDSETARLDNRIDELDRSVHEMRERQPSLERAPPESGDPASKRP